MHVEAFLPQFPIVYQKGKCSILQLFLLNFERCKPRGQMWQWNVKLAEQFLEASGATLAEFCPAVRHKAKAND